MPFCPPHGSTPHYVVYARVMSGGSPVEVEALLSPPASQAKSTRILTLWGEKVEGKKAQRRVKARLRVIPP